MKKWFCLATILFLSLTAVFAQNAPESSNVALFSVNYYGSRPGFEVSQLLDDAAAIGGSVFDDELSGSGNANTDNIFLEAISGVDGGIRELFSRNPAVTLFSFPQRLGINQLPEIENLFQEYATPDSDLPNNLRIGRELLSRSDISQLLQSTFIVIPRITYYQLTLHDSGNWEAQVITNIRIIRTDNLSTIVDFSLETSGYDPGPRVAMRSAVEGIASQLEYELGTIDEFALRAVVLERIGNRLVISLGSSAGVKLGDEFEVTAGNSGSGSAGEQRTALIKVYDVNREFSIARIIYERNRVVSGNQVAELPRDGVGVTVYTGMVWDFIGIELYSLSFGIKASPDNGFYSFKPLLGIEVLLSQASLQGDFVGVPVSLNFGAQYDVFLGRLRLVPQAILGFIGQIPGDEDEDFYFKGIKSSLLAGIGYLLPGKQENTELYIEGGYELQWGLGRDSDTFVQGVSVSLGLRMR